MGNVNCFGKETGVAHICGHSICTCFLFNVYGLVDVLRQIFWLPDDFDLVYSPTLEVV